jgi:hypothetical protein
LAPRLGTDERRRFFVAPLIARNKCFVTAGTI